MLNPVNGTAIRASRMLTQPDTSFRFASQAPQPCVFTLSSQGHVLGIKECQGAEYTVSALRVNEKGGLVCVDVGRIKAAFRAGSNRGELLVEAVTVVNSVLGLAKGKLKIMLNKVIQENKYSALPEVTISTKKMASIVNDRTVDVNKMSEDKAKEAGAGLVTGTGTKNVDRVYWNVAKRDGASSTPDHENVTLYPCAVQFIVQVKGEEEEEQQVWKLMLPAATLVTTKFVRAGSKAGTFDELSLNYGEDFWEKWMVEPRDADHVPLLDKLKVKGKRKRKAGVGDGRKKKDTQGAKSQPSGVGQSGNLVMSKTRDHNHKYDRCRYNIIRISVFCVKGLSYHERLLCCN